jgi:hypothetical protein
VVSIVIVNFNGGSHTRNCLAALAAHPPAVPHEIILVDNGSTDDSAARVREEFPGVKLLALGRNPGFGAANNAGVRESTGDHLFFLNNDTLFGSDPVGPLCLLLAAHPDWGVVGPRLRNADGTFQLSFGRFPSFAAERRTRAEMRLLRKRDAGALRDFESRYSETTAVDWISGAAMLVRREAFEAAGGFDEGYFLYFEDSDLCRRIAGKGYRTMYEPSLELTHLGGVSYAPNDPAIAFEYRRSQLRYYDAHNSPLERLLVRLYLLASYGSRFLLRRDPAHCRRVLGLLFRRRSA